MLNFRLLANVALFQAAWWAVILLHNDAALLVIALYLLIHFRWIAWDAQGEARFVLLASAVGMAVDGVWFYVGLMGSGQALWLPLWLLGLWPVFFTTVHHSLYWLKFRPGLAAVLAGLLAPLSYWAGASMTPVSFADPLLALAAVGACWALLLPVSLRFVHPPSPAGRARTC